MVVDGYSFYIRQRSKQTLLYVICSDRKVKVTSVSQLNFQVVLYNVVSLFVLMGNNDLIFLSDIYVMVESSFW